MPAKNDGRTTRPAISYIDPEASVHDLLNDATEWLQLSRGLSGLLDDLLHEADAVELPKMALAMEAVGALTHMGLKCVAQAHARSTWERIDGPVMADRHEQKPERTRPTITRNRVRAS